MASSISSLTTAGFARRIGDDLILLKHQPEIHDPEHDQQEQGKRKSGFDELGARVALPPAANNFSQCSHNATTVPTKIGTAYARRGPLLPDNEISSTGPIPTTLQ